MTDIIPLLTFVLVAVVVVVAFHIDWDWRRRAEFVSAFVDDPHFTVEPGDRTRPVRLATKGSTPAGHVVAGGGKPPYWQALSNAPRTAERTTLTITLEGISGGLRDKLGAHDVHTGDAGFDDRYCLRGSDEAVLRGLLQAPAVRAALDTLFGLGRIRSFTIDATGAAHTFASRDDLSPVRARDVLLCTLALVAALEKNASVRPALPPLTSSPLVEGAGGGSGAPVAVPVFVDERRRR